MGYELLCWGILCLLSGIIMQRYKLYWTISYEAGDNEGQEEIKNTNISKKIYISLYLEAVISVLVFLINKIYKLPLILEVILFVTPLVWIFIRLGYYTRSNDIENLATIFILLCYICFVLYLLY